MIEEKVELSLSPNLQSKKDKGNVGQKCKVQVNAFRLEMNPSNYIYCHSYTIDPPPQAHSDERIVLSRIWDELRKLFKVFVVKLPGVIYSPIHVAAAHDIRSGEQTIRINLRHVFASDKINSGEGGGVEIVAQHLVNTITQQLRYQKVGRRFFSNNADGGGKCSLGVVSGFHAGMIWSGTHGPLFQLDSIGRLMQSRSVLDTVSMTVASTLDGEELNHTDGTERGAEVKAEWLRICVGATVITPCNQRVYRVKMVHFEMSPLSTFTYIKRAEKKTQEMTFQKYYESYYHPVKLSTLCQPMLEAWAERECEKIFLVPEICQFTGFTNDIRNNKVHMSDAMKAVKASPQERLATLSTIASQASLAPQESERPKTLDSWNFRMAKEPLEVEARVFDPFEVDFGAKKSFVVEDGNFHRFLRNGLQCPGKIENWLFIYPTSDASVIEIWLRSLRDIAQVAFGLVMGDPKQIECTEQRDELTEKLAKHLTPQTQMVLLLTPQTDAKRVYQIFKHATCVKYPCVSQVVNSETVRRRQSIAAVLSRIVLQINAKFGGPLWHVDLKTPLLDPFFKVRTMVIGVDIFVSPSGEKYIGFAASIDRCCSEYYSTASLLSEGSADKQESMKLSIKIQAAYRDALVHFAKFNDGLLPDHIVVYRASSEPRMWRRIQDTEVEGLLSVNRMLKAPATAAYEPKLTWVLIEKHTLTRFFACTKGQLKNVEPGTVVDDSALVGECSFYLVNQAVAKGTSIPTHYTVIFDSGNVTANALQTLTHRLSFLYYNNTGSVRMPAPAQYAKKIARFVGTAVKAEPHKRLLRTLFYL